MKKWLFSPAVTIAAGLFMTANAQAEGYRLPPKEIADIVLRAPEPSVSLSPDGKTLLLLERESLPPVSELAKPMERLAGQRLDVATNDNFNPRNFVGLSLQDIESGVVRDIALPVNADIADQNWSPDGRYVAFTNTTTNGMSLWVLDTRTAEAREVLNQGINPVFHEPRWLPDGGLLILVTPKDRGAKPVPPLTPTGPAIQDAKGGQDAQTRTYQDLLKNPHDAALYNWLGKSQPMIIRPDGSDAKLVGEPRIYVDASASPDGDYLLMEWIHEPFSYQVPWYRFPKTTAVSTMDGDLLKVIVQQPLADNLPVQGVITGPRRIQWHPTADSTLMWAEALDGGDPRTKTNARDAMMTLSAPFTDESTRLHVFEDRYSGVMGIDGTDDVITYDYDRDTRELRTSLLDVTGSNTPRVIEVRNVQDAYADTGDPIEVLNEAGFSVAHVNEGKLFLTGNGATPDGARPFLRSFDLETFETAELWRNTGEEYEYVVDLAAADGSAFVTYYENSSTPGNYRFHTAGKASFLTNFPDPHPELTGISRELITYKREDGVELSSTLYLPPSYQEGDTLPVVVWAYPREFNNAATAGQVRDSKYRFTRIGRYSHLFFLTQGYAVMDRAAMPVVGADPETVNDSFIEQVVASAQAAVDESVARGFGDGERVGVGGHSYGAFMTAHLLAQSDIFRAGIARSGAYNRTLTPFGFQAERRIFWDTPETYYKLSPFMAANMINEPLLLIHGAKDNNSGTFPQQSERMFAAIKGTGGTTRLVMLPHESHGYRGRESVLHTLAEMVDWFDTHVKDTATDDN
ncbi:MAG: S9 family peptidase [Litorimonas sp.]